MYPDQRINSVQLFLYYGKALFRVFEIFCTKKAIFTKQNKIN